MRNKSVKKIITKLKNYFVGHFLPTPMQGTLCLGFPQNKKLIKVELKCNNQIYDVSDDCVIWSLYPLIFVVSLTNKSNFIEKYYSKHPVELHFLSLDNSNCTLIGKIELSFEKQIIFDENTFLLFSVKSVYDYRMPQIKIKFDNYLNRVRNKRNSSILKKFYMNDKDIEAFTLYYSAPQIVVIVSVSHNGRNNLFPMDLLGTFDINNGKVLFTLALRKTSPSITIMLESGKIVIGCIPIDKTELIFKLGKHHKEKNIDWNKLNIETIKSREFGFRVPEWSNNIKELSIEHSFEEGSHRVFLCSIVSESAKDDYDKMHHVSGRYMHFLNKYERLK